MKNKRFECAVIMVFFLAVNAANAEELALLPLTQSFSYIDVSAPVNSVFLSSESEINVLVSSSGPFAVELITPEGTVVNEENAATLGYDWSSHEGGSLPLFAGAFSLIISSKSASIGWYSFSLSPVGVVGSAQLQVTHLNSVSGRMVVASNDDTFVPERPFTVAAFLLRRGSPVKGASVVVQAVTPDGTEVFAEPLALKDDGAEPDDARWDGVYSGVMTLTDPGTYRLRAQVVLTDSVSGAEHRGEFFETLEVADAAVQLSGDYKEIVIDVDGDGLMDGVTFLFLESAIRVDSEYSLTITLQDSQGTSTITATSLVSDASAPLSVTVPSVRLGKLNEDGPWIIKSLNIWSGPKIIGIWHELGMTQPYRLSSLERKNTIIEGIVNDAGNDADGDGVYDFLDVIVNVNTLLPGYYGFSVDLKSASNIIVSSDHAQSIYLNQGDNHVPLQFLGSNIGRVGQDGPYLLTNMLVYSNYLSKATAWKDKVGETAAYVCSDFAGCDGDMVAEINRIAGIVCEQQGRLLRVKLKKIQKFADKNPSAAQQQISGLYARAIAIERSGSCPPAYGVLGDSPKP